MALKFTSTAWVAANDENRQQRDSNREGFFARTGVTPARSLRQIHIPFAARGAHIAEQFAKARENRISDDTIVEAATCAEAALLLVGLGTGSIRIEQEYRSLGLIALSPEVLKNFFLTDQETALERALF